MSFLSLLVYLLSIGAAAAAFLMSLRLAKAYRLRFLTSYLGFLVAFNIPMIINLVVNDLSVEVLKDVPSRTTTPVYILFGLIAFPLLALAYYFYLDVIAGLLDEEFPAAFRIAYGLLWAGLLAVFLTRIQFALREKAAPLLEILNTASGMIVLVLPLAALAYLFIRSTRRSHALERKHLQAFAAVSIVSFLLFTAAFILIPSGMLSRLAVPVLLFTADVAPVLVLGRFLRRFCPPVLPGIFEGEPAARFKEEHEISAREGEILSLLLKGKSNAQIEKELFISPNTVRNHVHNIYKKLGVSSRLQLMNLVRKSLEGGEEAGPRSRR